MMVILSHAKQSYILLAVLVILAWIATMGISYFVIYRIVGIDESPGHMIALSSAAMNFLGIVTPSAGFSSLALFISDAKQKGISSARVTISCILYILFDYLGLFVTAIVGLLILLDHQKLRWPEITATCLLGAMIGGLVLFLYLSSNHFEGQKKILEWTFNKLEKIASLFFKNKKTGNSRIIHFSEEIHFGAKALHNNYQILLLPIGLGFINKVLLILILAVLFLSFGLKVDLGVVVSGFVLGNLFTIISPTPSGIGIVEGMMTLALNSLGIELETAALLTLSFRAITFWLPFFIGMITFNLLLKNKKTVQA